MPGGALDEGGAFGVRVSPERTIEPWRVQFPALNSAWSEFAFGGRALKPPLDRSGGGEKGLIVDFVETFIRGIAG
jgi:hypothetical protein